MSQSEEVLKPEEPQIRTSKSKKDENAKNEIDAMYFISNNSNYSENRPASTGFYKWLKRNKINLLQSETEFEKLLKRFLNSEPEKSNLER